jgi:hypothetical protein
LREQIAGQGKKMSEIQKQVADNEIISKEALQMSNYNQQYSRKSFTISQSCSHIVFCNIIYQSYSLFLGTFFLALIILYFTSELTNFTITGLASPIFPGILCIAWISKEINEKISEKSNKQTKAIENLTKENEELREQIAGQRKKMSEIQKQVADNEIISKEALQMSNYTQQYSRKLFGDN